MKSRLATVFLVICVTLSVVCLGFSVLTLARTPGDIPKPVPVAPPTSPVSPTSAPATQDEVGETTTQPEPDSDAVVTAGAYCSQAGATGVTKTGKPMVCRTSSTDSRNRWRAP